MIIARGSSAAEGATWVRWLPRSRRAKCVCAIHGCSWRLYNPGLFLVIEDYSVTEWATVD